MTTEKGDLEHPKWPHLENLDRVPELLRQTGNVVVTEKIHGFNARMGRTTDGVFWTGGRNNVQYEAASSEALDEPVGKQASMQGFTPWAIEQADRISSGTTYFGEWAGKGIQKGIDYGEKAFYLFGMGVFGRGLQPVAETGLAARLLDCAHVPVLYDGPMSGLTMEMLKEWRVGPSRIADGEQSSEGVCICAEPLYLDDYGHIVIGKYKSPEFAERSSERKPKKTPADLTNVQAFVEEFATDERLGHVLDQLREVGMDGMDRRNTGALLKTYHTDVLREGQPEYEALTEDDQKMVGKVLNSSVKALIGARLDAVIEAEVSA